MPTETVYTLLEFLELLKEAGLKMIHNYRAVAYGQRDHIAAYVTARELVTDLYVMFQCAERAELVKPLLDFEEIWDDIGADREYTETDLACYKHFMRILAETVTFRSAPPTLEK